MDIQGRHMILAPRSKKMRLVVAKEPPTFGSFPVLSSREVKPQVFSGLRSCQQAAGHSELRSQATRVLGLESYVRV